MSAVRQISTFSNGGGVGSGTTTYTPTVSAEANPNTTESTRQTTYRTAGTLSNLMVNKTAGNRTGMSCRVRVAGANGNGLVSFTSTNGIYEDLTGSDSITAGQAVAFVLVGGTGGSIALNLNEIATDWAATGTTTQHFGTASLSPTASQTAYVMPASFSGLTTTQAEAEWLVKLPPSVDHVTLKNLYVRNGATAPTNALAVSVTGASGSGTAPSVSVTAGNTTYEDTTHSVQARDGDKVSIKVVSGAGTQAALSVVAFEVQSDDGVSFQIYGVSNGASIGIDRFAPLAGLASATFTTTTELPKQVPARALGGKRLGLLSAYVKTAGTGSKIRLRSNAADASGPVSVDTTATGWVTDSTHYFTPAATDLLNYSAVFGSVAATLTCVALTCQDPQSYSGAAALSGSSSLAGSGVLDARTSAALSAAGSLASTGRIEARGSASLAGLGSLSAAGSRTAQASAALAGQGSLSVGGVRTAISSAALTGLGSMVVSGSSTGGISAVLTGVGSLAASGYVGHPGIAHLAGQGQLSAAGQRTAVAAASLIGHGSLAGAGRLEARTGASLSGSSSLTSRGSVGFSSRADLSGLGALVAAGFVDAPGQRAVRGVAVQARHGTPTGPREGAAIARRATGVPARRDNPVDARER